MTGMKGKEMAVGGSQTVVLIKALMSRIKLVDAKGLFYVKISVARNCSLRVFAIQINLANNLEALCANVVVITLQKYTVDA